MCVVFLMVGLFLSVFIPFRMSPPDHIRIFLFFFFQAEDGIRDLVRSRGLGDVYKRQGWSNAQTGTTEPTTQYAKIKTAHD